MKAYERLSKYYDSDWGEWAKRYIVLIETLLKERNTPKADILDLACGTGNLAIALADRGHSVVGIDISPEMIAIAKAKATGKLNIKFDIQDMARFSIPSKFDLVTCTFDSINYLLNLNDVRVLFQCVSSVLKKSGIFIFDSNTHTHYTRVGNGSIKREIGGESFKQDWGYDTTRREAKTSFYFSDGSIEIHIHHPYDLTELAPVIADTGFRLVHCFDSFDNRPFRVESPRLICMVEKIADSV